MTERPYVELHAASAFSFLRGASLPEDLVEQAVALQLPAMALVDWNGVYGAPRFYKAARAVQLRALVGAEVTLMPAWSVVGDRQTTSTAARDQVESPRLTLLVRSCAGYQNLCRLLTRGALRHGKGATVVSYEEVHVHADGLHCLTGGEEGPLARALHEGGLPHARRLLERLMEMFPGRLHVELQRHHQRLEEHRNQALLDLARALGLPVVATNGVRYAKRADKELADVLAGIRHGLPLDAAGALLDGNRERHLKDARAMRALFADLPRALDATIDLAHQLDFTLADLGYRFPSYPVPPGETSISFLRSITWRGARERFRPLTLPARAQLEKELCVIEKLELAGYFLVVWDIVQFCRREKIMAQGRGSAANSAVCYALSITAVDPVKMELLFERFLSPERGEWPDIDLDLPSGDKRERVIQHVYQKYGTHGAAMTANVITYRAKSAAREVGKVLGYSTEQVDRLSQQLSHWHLGEIDAAPAALAPQLAAAGVDPDESRAQHFARMFLAIQNLPRHLGQHSGGMVLAGGRLDQVVPLEPASMPGRVVVQWDKDDCADLGLIKVDLLGLGMLAALEQAVIMVREHEGKTIDLAQLPKHDERVFRMLRAADTVGVFQVESRAQMASLPRHQPRTFYDLVVQVAIIRPGPIVGGMLKIFFERRRGR
ncbi:MAG: DNA polymerase III subunit alpha, partial [Planctomycetota bacterium]